MIVAQPGVMKQGKVISALRIGRIFLADTLHSSGDLQCRAEDDTQNRLNLLQRHVEKQVFRLSRQRGGADAIPPAAPDTVLTNRVICDHSLSALLQQAADSFKLLQRLIIDTDLTTITLVTDRHVETEGIGKRPLQRDCVGILFRFARLHRI